MVFNKHNNKYYEETSIKQVYWVTQNREECTIGFIRQIYRNRIVKILFIQLPIEDNKQSHIEDNFENEYDISYKIIQEIAKGRAIAVADTTVEESNCREFWILIDKDNKN